MADKSNFDPSGDALDSLAQQFPENSGEDQTDEGGPEEELEKVFNRLSVIESKLGIQVPEEARQAPEEPGENENADESTDTAGGGAGTDTMGGGASASSMMGR